MNSRALTPQVEPFGPLHVYIPNSAGTGALRTRPRPLSYEQMAADAIHFLDEVIAAPVLSFGVSDGAVIALTVARCRPDLVQRLVLAAGVFRHDGWLDGVLDGEPPDFAGGPRPTLTNEALRHALHGAAALDCNRLPVRQPALIQRRDPIRHPSLEPASPVLAHPDAG